jgi:hypothetical protein
VRHTNAHEINELFAVVYQENISSSFGEFIESIHAFWSQRGYLTERQYAGLKRAATLRGWRAADPDDVTLDNGRAAR